MSTRRIDRWKMIIPPGPWERIEVREGEGDVVVLLHGLWRGRYAMEPMAAYLNDKGYYTVNIPYPSFTKPIEELADYVVEMISSHVPEERRVHLVTHSLGGIITRCLLNNGHLKDLGRLVMLAPPNNGSEIIDWLSDNIFLSTILGPASRQLGRVKMSRFPQLPENCECGIVMGNKSTIPFFRFLLESNNDGIISVDDGRLPGVSHFRVVRGDHTFMMSESEVQSQVVHFLSNGSFL